MHIGNNTKIISEYLHQIRGNYIGVMVWLMVDGIAGRTSKSPSFAGSDYPRLLLA
jgi:hypothetical protein